MDARLGVRFDFRLGGNELLSFVLPIGELLLQQPSVVQALILFPMAPLVKLLTGEFRYPRGMFRIPLRAAPRRAACGS